MTNPIEGMKLDDLEARLASPFRSVAKPKPKRKRKRRVPEHLAGLERLYQRGIVSRVRGGVTDALFSIPKPVNPKPQVDAYDMVDAVNPDAFIAEYGQAFSEAHTFWLSILRDSLAVTNAYHAVLNQLNDIPQFVDTSGDTALAMRLLRYSTAKRICDHLQIDVDKALEGGDTGGKQLRQLLDLLAVSNVQREPQRP